MKIHLQREIDRLKKRLFHLSSLVEENLQLSIQSVREVDADLAAAVRRRDKEIDQLEVEVEEECLKILALYHPVAADLRFLISALKMNNDLERIGDLAVNIAKATRCLAGTTVRSDVADRLNVLGHKSRNMLRSSLEALMDLDLEKARAVLADDDEVDALYHELARILREEMVETAEQAESIFCWLMAAKSIERVADHATNIAEDTIYTIDGEIIRHGLG